MDHEKSPAVEVMTLDERAHNTSPSQKTAMPRWRSKGKEKSTIALACTWVVDHQISIALNLLSALFLTHAFFPVARHHTQKFFRISYYNPATGRFALGWDDIFFVFYWIIVFTGARCSIMDYILTPLAAWAGIERKKARVRFAEQAWILLYYGAFWSCGMCILLTSPYATSLRALWHAWPTREMSGLSKWYYLVQFAFWLQQIVVVNIEERRKDHVQMFTHHVITCTLIFTSYGYHQTKVGNLILCLMDVVDLFLPLAKILKYLKWRRSCDVAFGVFMLTWFLARHVGYLAVCYSVWKHIPQEIAYGCYAGGDLDLRGPMPVPAGWDYLTLPFLDPVGLVCWNDGIKWVFLSLLLALQVELLIWFTMICRVAYKVISGEGADDTRSDDDEEEDEEEDDDDDDDDDDEEEDEPDQKPLVVNGQVVPEKKFLGKQVRRTDAEMRFGAPAAAHRADAPAAASSPVRRSSRTRRKADPSGAHATGVHLLANSDRKELLGRIGCDKNSCDDVT